MKKFLAIALAALLVVAMAVPASAAVMSKQQVTDPHVKQQTNKNGKKVDFVIYDGDGQEVEGTWNEEGTQFKKDGNTYELIMIPYHNKDSESTPADIRSALEVAYAAAQAGALDEIAGTKILNSLVYIGLKMTSSSGSVSYVGVSDISEAAKMLVQFQENYTLAVSVDGKMTLETKDGNFVVVGEDGVYALFKDQGTGKDDGKSPQTGYESNTGIVVAVSLVAALTAVVGVCYIVDKKRA